MRVHFHTFGCKANQYDSERMRQEVHSRGGSSVPDWRSADVCVVNTCTVTNQADAEARSFIRRLRRDNPDARIVVAGCSAALHPDTYRRIDGVSRVVPGHDAAEVAAAVSPPALVQLALARSRVGACTPERGRLDLRSASPGAGPSGPRPGATRGWLKVQDGCDRHCAFCATRLARGASRSRPSGHVIDEARRLAEHHPELVLTGIHIGHYGLDLTPTETLSGLVARLLDAVPAVRFRLGSVEATEVDDALVDMLAGSGGRLAPHLHMPMQSGADPVLRRMRRWHSREAYRARAAWIAERVPRLGLGADVITGFPGETAADHASTVRLVEELPFTYLHVFPFSPRDDTAAADLHGRDPVPQRVANERGRELRELGLLKGAGYRAGRAGEMARVVVEGDGSMGLTEDYLRVAVRGAGDGDRRGLHAALLETTEGHLYIDLSRAPGEGGRIDPNREAAAPAAPSQSNRQKW